MIKGQNVSLFITYLLSIKFRYASICNTRIGEAQTKVNDWISRKR
nr:MAG TPA: hypothetical protein [Caudoviricetes sp.]